MGGRSDRFASLRWLRGLDVPRCLSLGVSMCPCTVTSLPWHASLSNNTEQCVARRPLPGAARRGFFLARCNGRRTGRRHVQRARLTWDSGARLIGSG